MTNFAGPLGLTARTIPRKLTSGLVLTAIGFQDRISTEGAQ
jgi:hypothetical protein